MMIRINTPGAGMLFRVPHITALVALILSLSAVDVRAGASPDPVAVHYFSQVQRQVMQHWNYPQSAARQGKTGQVEVRVSVARDGSVEASALRAPSSHAELNQAAQNAVQASAPFPPFPDSIRETSVAILFRFSYLPKDPPTP